jgi:cytochrome b6-f complex iron-sulfur subunit
MRAEGFLARRRVVITRVLPGSTAERAGLRPGDAILKVDGIPVATAEEVEKIGAKWAPGQTVRLRVRRKKLRAFEQVEVRLTLMRADEAEKLRQQAGGPDSPVKLKVGFPEEFDPREVDERFPEYNILVVREGGRFFALDRRCPHCADPPRRVDWLAAERRFKCAGCGSGFKITGIRFEGPARRALCRFAIRMEKGGQLEVDSGRRFRQDLGQWDHPDSFVEDKGVP